MKCISMCGFQLGRVRCGKEFNVRFSVGKSALWNGIQCAVFSWEECAVECNSMCGFQLGRMRCAVF